MLGAIAILDVVVLCAWFSRPGGYFCPVLTAVGKLDCAPK
jgi:hypothetical protein